MPSPYFHLPLGEGWDGQKVNVYLLLLLPLGEGCKRQANRL